MFETIQRFFGKGEDTDTVFFVALGLWGLYCLLSALYVFPSGLPQPADLIMAVLLAVLLVQALATKSLTMEPDYRLILFWGLGFIAYVFLITAYRAVELSDAALMRFPVYYAYNVAVLGAGLILGTLYRERFVQITLIALTAIAVAQIIYLLTFGEYRPGLRVTGFFNNPNQFGYFGLLLIMLAVASAWTGMIRKPLAVFSAVAGVMVIVMSISKATVLGLLVFVPLVFYRYPIYSIAGLLIMGIIGYLVKDTAVVDTMIRQVEYDLSKGDNTFEARGYYRLLDYPGYFWFGAGEGAYHRFIVNKELHSTPGTILFSYGIPGTLAFISMLWMSIRKSPLPGIIMIMPALVYGLAHQGLRFTLFWIVLACIAVAISVKTRQDENQSVEAHQ